ncbi:MAG: NifU family protein [Bradyrhizobiaceae bacterium]|nr:NifU family protein [Bradyrhizobiaceae bacterium]
MSENVSIEARIQAALEEVRPYLQMDRGDVEFVSFEPQTGIVELRFSGACVGCAMLPMTLRAGIERTVRAAVPEVRRVEVAR